MSNLPAPTRPVEPSSMWKPGAAMDPARLEYLWTLAERMSKSTVVPETLRTEGTGNQKKPLAPEQIHANVFAVVEQADRWNASPFGLLASAAIVRGKLAFEGKALAAVLDLNFGIDLDYAYEGEAGTDARKIIVSGEKVPGKVVTIEGTVSQWKTTDSGSPWRPLEYDRQLAYRGAREWIRRHKPAVLFGVLTTDEASAIAFEDRATGAKDITNTLADRYSAKPTGGFDPAGVTQQIGHLQSEQVGAMPDLARRDTSSTPAGREGPHQPDPGAQKAGASEGGEAGDPPARLPAESFVAYSKVLARFGDEDKLKRAAADHWSKNGGWPPANPADHLLAKAIFGAHSNRVAGKLSPEDTMAHISEEIDDSYGRAL